MLAPDNVRAPFPVFVNPNEPPIIPPSVNVLAEQVIVLLAVSVIAPVLCVKVFDPVKVKSLPIDIAFVIDLAAVTSSVPPEIVKVPVPKAVLCPRFKLPADKVVPNVKVLAPDNVSSPIPIFVKP